MIQLHDDAGSARACAALPSGAAEGPDATDRRRSTGSATRCRDARASVAPCSVSDPIAIRRRRRSIDAPVGDATSDRERRLGEARDLHAAVAEDDPAAEQIAPARLALPAAAGPTPGPTDPSSRGRPRSDFTCARGTSFTRSCASSTMPSSRELVVAANAQLAAGDQRVDAQIRRLAERAGAPLQPGDVGVVEGRLDKRRVAGGEVAHPKPGIAQGDAVERERPARRTARWPGRRARGWRGRSRRRGSGRGRRAPTRGPARAPAASDGTAGATARRRAPGRRRSAAPGVPTRPLAAARAP